MERRPAFCRGHLLWGQIRIKAAPASRAPRPGDTHPAPPPPARSRPAARPPRALRSAPLATPIGVVWRSPAPWSFTSPALVG